MNIHTTLIPATIASCVAIATCVGRVPAEETRETVATSTDRSIPLSARVADPISDEDWRQVASRYDLVFTLFSPKAGGKDLTSENERVRWIKSPWVTRVSPTTGPKASTSVTSSMGKRSSIQPAAKWQSSCRAHGVRTRASPLNRHC